MEKYCDLHTHSTFSDGTCTPAQIVDMAIAIGLSAVALCDHNTIGGLPEFFTAAQGKPIAAIGGVELSTEHHGKTLHIVGLYLRPSHYASITALMEWANREKEASNRELVENLCMAGYPLDYEEIRANYASGQINRAHIAAALTDKGYTASIEVAFRTLLSKKSGYYHEPRRITALDAIAHLKSIGAVAILAHPFLDFNEEELVAFLPSAKEAGLDGMETLYSKFDAQQRTIATQIAQQFALLPSGGSDFHGEHKPDILLGRGRGDLFVPASFLTAMKQRNNR